MGLPQWLNWRIINVIILGASFLFIFSGFMTSSMAEQSVLEGAANEPNSTFKGSGYLSLSIIYASFAFANFIAPFFVVLIGPKYSMFITAAIYGLFIASFLKPIEWVLYFGSALLGIAASILWTAQGNYLSLIADETFAPAGRISGIFWAIFQGSLLFGNLYQYFAFKGAVEIDKNKRTPFYVTLTISAFVGVFGLLLLKNVKRKDKPENQDEAAMLSLNNPKKPSQIEYSSACNAIKNSFKLLFRKDMILLSFLFFYSGLELTFYSGVFGTSVGHTKYFGGEAKSYIGLVGIAVGIGEILGGIGTSIFTKGNAKMRRSLVVTLGIVTHLIAMALTFLTIPTDAPINESSETTYLTPSLIYVIVSAFLFGLGDSAFNTQMIAILCELYPNEDSPSAFAIFKFMQSLASAIAFFYSIYLHLTWQLLILVIMGVSGTLTFISVDSQIIKKNEEIRIF